MRVLTLILAMLFAGALLVPRAFDELSRYYNRQGRPGLVSEAGREIAPDQGTPQAGWVIRLPRQPDGQFWLDAQVDGVPVRFLVDTGASHSLLSPADADRLGFRPDRLSFRARFQTANGEIRGAPVTLKTLSTPDGLYLTQVDAFVSDVPGAGVSLLGMDTLNRLQSVELRGDALLLLP